jgi:hypothetical protein
MSRQADLARLPAIVLALSVATSALPVAARDSSQPAANRDPDARDVAMTPVTDLNLAKDEVPAVLLAAVADPYTSTSVSDCRAIETSIAELDAVLGPDMDIVVEEGDRLSTGRMAKSVVASFIPFRGILREITGAAEQERDWRAAIYAGSVRRGFLKGLGQQKGCAYPARPAFTRVTMSETPEPKQSKGRKRVASGDAPLAAETFVSEPVVQSIPPARR